VLPGRRFRLRRAGQDIEDGRCLFHT